MPPLDRMPALHQRAAQGGAFLVAVGGLAHQAQVAVAGGVGVGVWHVRDAAQGGGQGARAGGAAPWLDEVTGKVHAARHGLQDGLARVELQVQRGQLVLYGRAVSA